jgi:polygalacturonase
MSVPAKPAQLDISSKQRAFMSANEEARRHLMKTIGIGISGVAVGSLTPLAATESAPRADGEFDVKAFGAIGDGKTLDTPAINRAIQAASASGGGTVRLPAGSYLCYSIHLKSNVSLDLGPGATIIAADPPAAGAAGGYDPPEPNAWDRFQDFGHSHWHNSLLWGEEIENVSIAGPGLIWGRGLSRGEGDTALPAGAGNKAISLKNCHNIALRDLSLLHAGHFAVLATGVDNFTIDNLKIDTNRDGIDIDCCRNVRVSNCSVNSPWDDGICLKSSYGLGYARSTDHVTITNCYLTGGYEEGTLLDATYKPIDPERQASRNGRIKFGTESNGGFRNITVSNCVVDTARGIALESVDGALLEDVSISNITMRDVTDVPFFIRLGRRMRGPEGVPVGELRRVNISNIVVSNCVSRQCALITGIPGHTIQQLKFSNLLIVHQGGGKKEDATIAVPELETAYPDPNRFGPLPAHGFFIRHVQDIQMRDVEVRCAKEDLRPGFVLEDVVRADFLHVSAQHVPGTPSYILKNVESFNVYESWPRPDTHLDKVAEQTL